MGRHDYFLSNNVSIPQIGFGTWKLQGDTAYDSVRMALATGYTHIDTAAGYENEALVGKAIRDSGIPRENIFVTTKLWNAVSTYEEAITAINKSLQELDLGYIDLMLIHWPNPIQCRENDQWKLRDIQCWKAMEEFYQAGKLRAIGVSNFLPHHLRPLLDSCTVKPMVNQIRLFPGLVDEETVAFCTQEGILLEAYSPLGEGALLNQPVVRDIAKKYGVTPAQLVLRWSLERGFLPLPKSTNSIRAAQNLNVYGFTLSQEDVNVLNTIEHGCRIASHPDTARF